MQEAQDSPPRVDESRRSPGAPLSPFKAFFLLLAVMVGAGLLFILLTREEPTPPAQDLPESKKLRSNRCRGC
jgi:hypothetical protein